MSLNELKSVAHYIMRIDSGFAIRDSRIKNLKPTITGYQNPHAMKKHSGMRPQDIVILLKIAIKGEELRSMKDLSQELEISASEVSESPNRSSIAGLLFQNKKQLIRQALMDFLQYGLRYVYPQQPGALVRGVPTAHAAPPLSEEIMSDAPYVWPHHEGKVRGQAIEPLYPSVPAACLKDPAFYEVMALCDALRVGRARERNIAVEELKKRIC